MKKSVPIVEVKDINGLVYLFIEGAQQPMCWTGDEEHNACSHAAAILGTRFRKLNNERRTLRESPVTFDSFAADVSVKIRAAASYLGVAA